MAVTNTVADVNRRSSRLLEPDIDRVPNMRPTTGPEIDDGRVPSSESGIDDGFLPSERPTEFGFDDMPAVKSSTPDVNIYQQKKTLAQGMMDLALLSANANQLRYVLESKGLIPYYFVSLTLISISISFQVGVGVMLIWNSRYDVKRHVDMCRANRINNYTVCSIFLITITNVFISVFAAGYSLPHNALPQAAGLVATNDE